MKTPARILVFLIACCAALTARAELVTDPTRLFLVGQDIYDVQNPPAFFTESITDSVITSLTEVSVGLRLVGVAPGSGFASEMFVSLNKDLGKTAILLNQVGISETDSIGAFYDGWDVTFNDSAAADVHGAFLQSGILRGLWQPDGRTDPASSSRNAKLNSFNGDAANGVWRLAVGDLNLGGQMRLESWSLAFTGETESSPTTIPETTPLVPSLFLVAIAFHVARKRAG